MAERNRPGQLARGEPVRGATWLLASPLVVLITFAGSLCCALSIGKFGGRLGLHVQQPRPGFGRGIAGLAGQASPLGYLTSRFWSPSVLWSIDLVIVLAGLSFVVASSVVFLFPLWGILYLAGATARHLPGPGRGRRTEPR